MQMKINQLKGIWTVENRMSTCAKVVHSRIFNLILLCLFVLCAGIYNYGLHRSFWFDYEYSIPIYSKLIEELYGLNIKFSWFSDIVAYLPYKLFGCSLKALRVYAVTIYQLILFLSVVAAIYSFERKRFEWYKLSIFSLIAVILHPGSSPFCGHYSTLFHQYPYDLHAVPVIFATFSVMLLCIHQGIKERKYKNILKIIILAVIIIGYKQADFLYIIGFVGPLICVGLIYLWKEKRKLFFSLTFGGMAVLALLHVISFVVSSLATLFAYTSIGYGTWTEGTTVYGNNGFANLSDIWNYISTTTIELLALFNIDISGKSMLSIGTLLAGFRFILVVYMFACSFKTVINAVRAKDDDQSPDTVDIVLALGIIFNFFIVMFSDYGNGGRCIRYMTLILFYGAIFLARQSENIIIKLHGKIDDRSKMYFFLFFSLTIVANMTTFWKQDDYIADYEPAMSHVSSFIIDNHLGNGIGGHTFATTLTIIGEGNYVVVEGTVTDEGLQIDFGEAPTTFNYIIDWPNGFATYDEETIYWCLGMPDTVYEIDGFMIYYYSQGFGK